MKTKRKTGKLLSLVLAFVLALGALPVMPGGVTSKAAETISTVSATTMTIVDGTKISDALKSVQFDTSKMSFDQVTFYDSEAGWQWNSILNGDTAEKFVEGKTYEITIRLEALEGYSFALTGATINGIDAVIETQSAGAVSFTCEYTVPEASAVKSVDIFVTAPKSGEEPNLTASIAEAQKDMVSVSGDVYWGYGEAGNRPVLSNEGIFVKGKEYTVRVTLEALPGYKLAEDTVCTINGNPAIFDKENKTATYTFPELEVTLIQNVDIFVTDPKSGEEPNLTASIADEQKEQVSVSGNVYWGYGMTGSYPVISNEGIFVKGKEYTVKAKLEPAEGYKFADDAVFTINGNVATFNKEYNTVTYKYPLLETTAFQTVEASCDLTGGVKFSDYLIGIPDDANYEVNATSVKWYDGVGSSTTAIADLTTTIDDTKEYTLEFDLLADDGYGFASTTIFDIALPKEASVHVTLYDETNKATIKVSFALGVVGDTNITVPIPVVGETLPTVESDNEDCIVDKVEWYCGSKISDSSYIVEEGKSYMAIITLKPGARYLFWDSFNLEEISQRITLNNEIVTDEHRGYKMDGTELTYDVTLESHCHNYSTEWSQDATNHWHECTICGAKKDEHEHVSGAPATENTPQTCTECGYEIAPAKGHSYSSEWSKDDNSHWHECTNPGCPDKTGSVKEKAAHTFDGGKVTTPATKTTKGVKTYTCTVCGMTKTESIPVTGDSAGSGTGDKGNTSGTGETEGNDTDTLKPAVGASVKDESGKADYKVTSADKTNPTLEYTAPVSNTAKTVSVPASITAGGVTYKVTAIADNAFKNNKNLTNIKIGSNVTTIGKNAFYGCKKLQKVTIGNAVTTIGASAFSGFTNLTTVTLGKNVKTIGASAFSGCKKLTKITLGNSVATIGASAFSGCSKLKTVTLGKNVTTIGDKAFYKCTSLVKITIPAKVSKIGKQAFYGCKKLKTITIKTTKLTSKKVGKNAFGSNAKKVTVTLPKLSNSKKASYIKMLKTKGLKKAKFK